MLMLHYSEVSFDHRVWAMEMRHLLKQAGVYYMNMVLLVSILDIRAYAFLADTSVGPYSIGSP